MSTALCILYAPGGSRDAYCTAIAGALLKHTEWSEEDINEFIIAVDEGSINDLLLNTLISNDVFALYNYVLALEKSNLFSISMPFSISDINCCKGEISLSISVS